MVVLLLALAALFQVASSAPVSGDILVYSLDSDETQNTDISILRKILLGRLKDYTTTTVDPRGINFSQFVALGRCKDNIAYSCFTDADSNDDGFVSSTELEDYQRLNTERVDAMYDEYLASSFQTADDNQDDQVSYEESRQFAEDSLRVHADDGWKSLFDDMDKNKDGELDEEEFYNLLTSWYRGDWPLKTIEYNGN